MFWSSLKSDLQRSGFLASDSKRPPWWRILLIPLFQQARVLFIVRLAVNGPRHTHRIARILLRSLYSIEIGDNVKIGQRLLLPHPQSIIIGQGVTIENNVSIAQFVTLGGNYRKTRERNGHIQKLPHIGSNVMIGPGAVVGGPVSIGDHVVIGANAVITKDIPSNHIAYGLSQISDRLITVDTTGSYTYINHPHEY